MIPRRTLLPIAAVVLAAHAWVLLGLPLQGSSGQPPAPTAVVLNTRMLAAPVPPAPTPPPPAPQPALQAQAAPAPKPAPARKEPPPPTRPAPAPKPAPAAELAAESPQPSQPAPQGPDASDSALEAHDSDAALYAAAALTDAPTTMASADTSAGPQAQPTPAPAQDSAAAATTAQPSAHAAWATDTALPAPVLVAQASTPAVPAATAAPPTPTAKPPAPASALEIAPPGASASRAPSTPPPVRLPAPTRLRFEVAGQVKKFNYTADAELLWQHDGQRYQARQELKVLFLGARTQTSTGEISAQGLLPQRFGDKSRSEQAAHFDYGRGRVTFSANTPEAALVAGTQDRLSIFVQLGALLAGAPERYPTGTRISLATVGARSADVWSFTVGAAETLHLPAGDISALKLQRLPRSDHDYDQKAELWLAPSLGYLPVRIQITQSNGDFADLRLREHSPP